MDHEHLAKQCWEKLRSQLEDRSVLDLGSVDKETLAELEAEQIETIELALAEWGCFAAGVASESTYR